MTKIIQMTEDEYKGLLQEFVKAWMEYQEKGYGCHLVDNETGEIIKHHDSVGGKFLIPWAKVFKPIYGIE